MTPKEISSWCGTSERFAGDSGPARVESKPPPIDHRRPPLSNQIHSVEGLTVRSDCRHALTSELRVQHEPHASPVSTGRSSKRTTAATSTPGKLSGWGTLHRLSRGHRDPDQGVITRAVAAEVYIPRFNGALAVQPLEKACHGLRSLGLLPHRIRNPVKLKSGHPVSESSPVWFVVPSPWRTTRPL